MKNIDFKETYILNPAYKFRSDITSMVITNEDSLYFDIYENNDTVVSGFCWKTHPLIAYLFSFFNGSDNLLNTINYISQETDFPVDELKKSIVPFIENNENMIFPLLRDKIAFCLPENFLIKKQKELAVRNLLRGINIQEIMDNLDLGSTRLKIPNEITFMVNNTCVTNCIYCYANKTHKVENQISFERIKTLIKEARMLQVRNVEVGGGEFFLYENWYELLKILKENKYNPLLSTKVPISESVIIKLKALGIKQIQISLDTIDNTKIMQILNVDNLYLDKMKNTLKNLEKHQIKVKIKSVITNINNTIEDVENLLNYLSEFKNIKKVSIAPGDYSLYKPFSYASTREKLEIIQEYIEKIKANLPYPLNMQGISVSQMDTSFEDRKASYDKRAQCSGNHSAYFILPDGKVTICEQMYWHPFFILGDVNNQSLMDVWNSEKATNLWNIQQKDIKPESPCHDCKEFEECRRGKGCCWRLAIEAYGFDNYDFPDYKCPYAPPVKNNVFHL